jgi:hypothetical protein
VTYHIMVAAAFGSGGTLTLQVSAALPPANDDFDHATHIASLPFTNTLDTTGATSAPDDPTTCGGTQQSVWYSFRPAVNETIFASTSSNGGFSTTSAYTGSRNALTQVACGNFSAATWVASAGVTYHIMVTSSSGGSPGTLTLQVTGALPPTNDNFGHATVVTAGLPFTTTEDVSGATTAANDPAACGGTKNSVWFRFTPTVSETFIADTTGSTYQPAVSVFTGAPGSLHPIACSGFTPFPRPAVKWAGIAGVTYHLMVVDGSPFGNATSKQLTLTLSGKAPPPNDDFNHATVIPALPATVTTDASGATTAPDDPTACGGPPDSSVWFNFTPTTNELVVADTNGSTYQPAVSVWTGARGALVNVTCGNFFQPASWQATAGVTYHLMVANSSLFGSAPAGQLTLHLQGLLAPPNDDISHATVIPRLPFNDTLDTTAATTSPSDPAACDNTVNATVWYKFTAPASGIISLDTAGSNYQTAVSAYSGSPGALLQIACGVNATNIFAVSKGTTYYFMVAAFPQQGGSLHFRVNVKPDVPANGPCTTLLTGQVRGSVTVNSGVTCVGNATVFGGVTVLPGGQLLMINATVNGSVTSEGASALAICNSSIAGQVSVRKSTGLVLIGDGGDGIGPCLGNKIGAGLAIGGTAADANTSGIELGGNTVGGQVTVSGNSPDPATVLASEDAGIEIEGNHVSANLACSHNSVAPGNDGLRNTVGGVESDQCAGL